MWSVPEEPGLADVIAGQRELLSRLRAVVEAKDAEVAALRPKVHRFLTTIFPDSIFVKTHCAVMEDHGVPTVTFEATAGAIYVVRNPMDVAISYSHHLGTSLDATIHYMAKMLRM